MVRVNRKKNDYRRRYVDKTHPGIHDAPPPSRREESAKKKKDPQYGGEKKDPQYGGEKKDPLNPFL
jgi:hypothetical protein